MENQGLLNPLSYTKNAILSTNYSDNYIAQGKGFSIEYVVTVTDSDSEFDVSFDTTNVDRDYIIAYPTAWNTSTGSCIITLGTCTSYTGGTELTPTNKNLDFSTLYPSQTIFKYDVVPTEFSASPTKILTGTESTPQASGGGKNQSNLPQWLTKGLKYIFRVENKAGADIDLGFGIYWFEV